jgi:hypothetical protein
VRELDDTTYSNGDRGPELEAEMKRCDAPPKTFRQRRLGKNGNSPMFALPLL